ncbi:hypothetical protein [Bacillus pinisoli]|uniref:hypothetical protein n=1 Tax=Bacillus pinisoli TaxID=2901866 RepID=UPI001FF6FC5F|nr:hypothetical protein [Bacillus pinisoli]
MNNAENIMKEISDLQERIVVLEQEIKSIQQECEHTFQGDTYSRRCKKCLFAEVLYY